MPLNRQWKNPLEKGNITSENGVSKEMTKIVGKHCMINLSRVKTTYGRENM